MNSDSAVAVAKAFRRLHSAGVWPDYEAVLAAAYGRLLLPGDVVLDVGAHGGKHTRQFAEMVGASGRVIAFEPLPHKAEELRANFAQNGCVEIRQIALADRSGVSEFQYAINAPEESGLRRRHQYNISEPRIEAIEVKVCTIDRQCADLSCIAYVKIDIEGGEMNCLHGARSTLDRCRPVLSVEYGWPSYHGYGVDRDELFLFAQSSGYVIVDLFGNTIGSLDSWHNVCDTAYWDYFLFPVERAEDLAYKISQ